MAIGWLTALQIVPWTDVISNASKITDGAKKLWKSVSKKSPAQGHPAESPESRLSPEAQAIAILRERLAIVEVTTADLHSQMRESSALIKSLADQNTQYIELIKSLADQNAQFIKNIEAYRIRVVWLTGATVVVCIIAVLGLTLAFIR